MGRNRSILVVFTAGAVRSHVMRHHNILYEEGRQLAHVHINEDLTPAKSSLLYRCRQSGRFKSVWSYDGDTYVGPWNRDPNAKGDRIFCEADIQNYPIVFQNNQPRQSINGGPNTQDGGARATQDDPQSRALTTNQDDQAGPQAPAKAANGP